MMKRVICFDTETTGLVLPSAAPLEKQPRIIELGAVLLVEGEIAEEYSQLVDPGEPITDEITKITGITNDQLRGMPTFGRCVSSLADLFAKGDVLICHNAPFDTAMLRNDLLRCGDPPFPWPQEIICSAQEYAPVLGARPTLKTLYQHALGSPLPQTHRALDDAKALASALLALGFLHVL